MPPNSATGVARLQGSFRDPSGHVFTREGEIYRQVNEVYREDYDFLMNSGLYASLTDAGLLVRHEETDINLAQAGDAYKILKPQVIPFISYPYEWTFGQLKHAALATLTIQRKALEFGMTLKDSSAFNVQFFDGKPIFIDTLSFQKRIDGEPWVAYRQFCQHFLAPLSLMTYGHIGMGQLSRIYIDGVPLDVAHSLLPMRTRFKPWMQMHIHLHARFQRKFAGDTNVKARRSRAFKLRAFYGLIESLESAVKQLKWTPAGTEWAEYYEDDSYTAEALEDKVALISGFLREVNPSTVWDLGANTGLFSRLASDMAIRTISFDKDPAAVEKNYLESVRREETHILPLFLDLTNPSPMIGWANQERMDFIERGPADMIFALGLIHHLAISENVPLNMLAEFFQKDM